MKNGTAVLEARLLIRVSSVWTPVPRARRLAGEQPSSLSHSIRVPLFRRIASLGAIAILSTHAEAFALAAQADSTVIPYRISCASCRVDFQRVATLGSPNDPTLISERSNVARDSRGRYYAASYNGGEVVVFDSSGKYLESFGKRGQGPGEIDASGVAGIVIGRGDSIYVLTGQRSVSVFSAEFKPVRGYPVQGLVVSTLTSQGRLVGSGQMRTSAAIGFDFHEFDSQGNLVNSFGRERRDVRPGDPATRPLTFSLSTREDGVWAVLDDRYIFGNYSITGARRTTFSIVGAPWVSKEERQYPPRNLTPEEYARAAAAIPPRPFFLVLGQDSNELLWIMWSIPVQSLDRRLTLEVIDPTKRVLVLSQPLDQRISFVRGSNLIAAATRNADGVLSFVISKPTVVTR